MKLDLSEIARIPGSYAEHEIDLTFREVEGITLTAPVHGRMSVSSTGNVLLLDGSVDTEVELECYRCEGTYRQPVHAEFQEEFVVRPPQTPGQGPRVEEERKRRSCGLFFPNTLDLNLDELLRQSILLALPLKPLCTEDCRGLCPQCGQRLQDGQCSCAPPVTTALGEVLRQALDQRRQR